MGESGLQEALFAELAAGAGVRAYGVPSHAGGLPANTGERRGGQKWTNAGIRPIRGWANRRLGGLQRPGAAQPMSHVSIDGLRWHVIEWEALSTTTGCYDCPYI